jgi:hypothetical protein
MAIVTLAVFIKKFLLTLKNKPDKIEVTSKPSMYTLPHFFKVRLLSVFLILLFWITPMQPALAFDDVAPNHPHHTAIMFLKEKGVVGGHADGTFRPNTLLNRAEALKLVLESAGFIAPVSVATITFPDVNLKDWFARYVFLGSKENIVHGNDDGTFTPNRQVNKAELTKMILRANGLSVEPLVKKSNEPWYQPYMLKASALGIVQNNNQSEIARSLTRGEASEMIYLGIIATHKNDTSFLLKRAEEQLSQVEMYIQSSELNLAEKSATLGRRFAEYALANNPEDSIIQAAVKITEAYQDLTKSFHAAVLGNTQEAEYLARQTVISAQLAVLIDPESVALTNHIQNQANNILNQLQGTAN